MSTSEAVPQVKRTPAAGHLYVSLELADKHWRLTASDGTRAVSRYVVAAGDQGAAAECIRKARARFRLSAEAPVHSCYEAGRDGWWLHRWLRQQGIDNIVVDAASIEVNRHARRAKTDRIDGDKLLGLLLRHHGGEARVWSVLREPSVEQEDARRTHREIGRLTHERNAHTNRISGLLVLHNLRARGIGDTHLEWLVECASRAGAAEAGRGDRARNRAAATGAPAAGSARDRAAQGSGQSCASAC